jgi:hypothetical protein
MADAADVAVDPAPLSTEIDTETKPIPSGGGQIPLPSDKPASVREDLVAVFKDADKAKAAEKPAPAPKEDKDAKVAAPANDDADTDKGAVRGPDGKFIAKPREEGQEGEAGAEGKSDAEIAATEAADKAAADKQGKRHVEPPKTFLPRAKELWRNTPLEVQSEVERLTREHEEETQRTSQVTQRYEALRPFDELARKNGRDLTQSLARINHVENLMQQSPLVALNMVLQEIGPRKADGNPLSLFEVAQFVAGMGPDGYNQVMGQARAQAQQQAPVQQQQERIQALEQKLLALQHQQIAQTIIEPVRQANPERYDQIQDDIAFFLESDKIPRSLSPSERLAAAYDMADRINPASHDTRTQPDDPAFERHVDDLSGRKSIKSAPGSVSERSEFKPGSSESLRQAIEAEARRMRRA